MKLIKCFLFFGEEDYSDEKEEFNLSDIDKNENDISNNISKIENYLSEIEIKNICIKLKEINNDFFTNKYFRLLLNYDENKNDNKLNYIYCIPEVIYEKGEIIFIYRKEKIKLEIEIILNLILNNKMFINKKEKEILKQAYFCHIHNKEYINYCYCKSNICEECTKEHFLHSAKGINFKKDINKINIKILQNKINYYKYNSKTLENKINHLIKPFFDIKNDYFNNNFKNILIKSINRQFNRIKKLLSFKIYTNIINSLILEYQEMGEVFFNNNLCENLLRALKFIREPKKSFNNFKIYQKKPEKIINSLIPFYSDDNESKSNIFMCITRNGYIFIISFNIYSNNPKNGEDSINNKIFDIINSQNLGNISPLKIMRLKKCFNHKDYPNLFLVSFSYSDKRNSCAKIVGILDDYTKISILKTFEYEKGLINAIEINLNNSYYLLNFTNGFTLWIYDSDKNEIKNKKIIPKRSNIVNKDDNNDYINFKTYKIAFYLEKKNLLIVQASSSPNQCFFFYSINYENNDFNIIFQSQIKINKETEITFSNHHINSCIIQEKYLLIGTQIKKDKINNIEKNNNLKQNNNIIFKEEKKNVKKAGIYIINLDNKKAKIEYIKFCQIIYYIIPFKKNMFICNYKSHNLDDQFFFYSISIFTLEEKNNETFLNQLGFINGKYQSINSDIIYRNFILCSSETKNSLLKINNNGSIYNYFDKIYIDN